MLCEGFRIYPSFDGKSELLILSTNVRWDLRFQEGGFAEQRPQRAAPCGFKRGLRHRAPGLQIPACRACRTRRVPPALRGRSTVVQTLPRATPSLREWGLSPGPTESASTL
jgi:hypothetical protein